MNTQAMIEQKSKRFYNARRFFRLDIKSKFHVSAHEKHTFNAIYANEFEYMGLPYQTKKNALESNLTEHLGGIKQHGALFNEFNRLFGNCISKHEHLISLIQSGYDPHNIEGVIAETEGAIYEIGQFNEQIRGHSTISYSITESLITRIECYVGQLIESSKFSSSNEFIATEISGKHAPYETPEIGKLCFAVATPTPLALFFLECSMMLDHVFETQKMLVTDISGKAKPEDWEKGVVNISEGGARFTTPKQIPTNAKVDFYLHLPDTKHYAQFTASIEGVRYCQERNAYETRLNFYFPDKEMQNKVKAEIQLQEFK